MDERWGLSEVAWFGLLALFGGYAGLSRQLFRWETGRQITIVAVGNVCVSILAALMAGLILEAHLEDYKLLLACAGAAGWLGGDVIEPMSRALVRVRHGRNGNGQAARPERDKGGGI